MSTETSSSNEGKETDSKFGRVEERLGGSKFSRDRVEIEGGLWSASFRLEVSSG